MRAMHDQRQQTKLAAARTRLILERPFLGALVLRLPLQESDAAWCATIATDARKIYYNRRYVDALSLDELEFALCHEALHCALSHFARRAHRLKRRWDLACDYAINPLLADEGLTAPPEALFEARFTGLSAEEIYPLLDEHSEASPLDNHLYDESDDSDDPGYALGDQPPPLDSQQQHELDTLWQQRLAGAAQQARTAGKLSDNMARLVERLLKPELPWRALLAKYLSRAARDDYTYARPSQRRGDPAILPGLHSHHTDVLVALDVSGSIRDSEIDEFLSEVDAIKGQVSARITLLACDAELAGDGPWVFEPWEQCELPAVLHGGGGTRFSPVFEWAAAHAANPDLLVYFTDACGEFPELPPGYPVVWLVKGKQEVPWGARIQLN